jgi:rubrerythrin
MENLKEAAAGEHEEAFDMYPKFAEIAEKEGFKQIAVKFRVIATVEAGHEKRYKTLLSRVETNETFVRPEKIEWQCRKCGYIHTGERPPLACPSCGHPQGYFEQKANNY